MLLRCCHRVAIKRGGNQSYPPTVHRPWKKIIRAMTATLLVVAVNSSAWCDSLTWSTLMDHATPYSATATYSLRGIALSPDDSKVYGTWLTTGPSKLIVEYNATNGAVLNSTTVPLPGSSIQAKSIATDDRGYVYLGTGDQTLPTSVRILSSDLQTQYATVSTTDAATKDKRVGGASIWQSNGQYYLYITRESGFGSGYIQRFNVTNPAAPFLDTTFGSAGTFNLQSLFPDDPAVGYLRGLEVGQDGTIYVTSTRTDTSANKANARVYKIAANLSSATYATVRAAMDVAIWENDLYVTQYDANNSAVAVLSTSNLSLEETLITGFSHSNTASDTGYSDIAISSTGHIFLADQLYEPGSLYYDRILESSALPTPIPGSAALLGSGLAGLMVWRRRSAGKG